MKIIIMAAGRGTRISRHIQGRPKCTIDIDGQPLIARTFKILSGFPGTDIAIVTGYNERAVIEAIGRHAYTKFLNPFFDVTNSIASLWFARDFIPADDDLIVMNGDLFFEKKVMETLYEEPKSPVMLADSSRIKEADYRFKWSGDVLQEYGKDLPDAETTGEYVGLAKISRASIPAFRQRMHELIDALAHGKWWEDILYSFVPEGRSVFVKDIKGQFWGEVDYIEDIQRLRAESKRRGL